MRDKKSAIIAIVMILFLVIAIGAGIFIFMSFFSQSGAAESSSNIIHAEAMKVDDQNTTVLDGKHPSKTANENKVEQQEKEKREKNLRQNVLWRQGAVGRRLHLR